jgi:hypothetical protein
MRAVTRIALGAALVVCNAFAFAAQTAAPAAESSGAKQTEVSFQFDRTGLPVPRFTLRIREDGTGSYQADQAEMPATANSMRGQAAQHIDRPITRRLTR